MEFSLVKFPVSSLAINSTHFNCDFNKSPYNDHLYICYSHFSVLLIFAVPFFSSFSFSYVRITLYKNCISPALISYSSSVREFVVGIFQNFYTLHRVPCLRTLLTEAI